MKRKNPYVTDDPERAPVVGWTQNEPGAYGRTTQMFRTLGDAIRARLDRWVYRPGVLKEAGRVRAKANWHIAVDRRTSSWLQTRARLWEMGRLRKDKAGRLWKRSAAGIWLPLREQFSYANLITSAGLNDLADVYLSGATATTSWYVIFFGATPSVLAGHTLASHAGWSEFTDYDESNRQAWTDGGASGASVDNSASPAVITSSSDSNTVGGAGLVANNTKGGTTGLFYGGGAFTGGNKSLDNGETLTATSTYSFADDGA